ncbi:Rrf2 family transcriptional regulator [Novipirellula sp.]|uniref:RrF2 family transcriptional regulator n=1 Tax=Novipirellula sp. TaxID=2795430 RepID=UPI0035652869
MVISARVHYACLAMLELAMRADDTAPVAVREITDQHNIPGPFLVQILRTLRTAGWVQSVRGSQGGYRLAIDPKQITLLDVAEAMGCQEGHTCGAEQATETDEALQRVWDKASEASREMLSSVRLSDLVEQCRHGEATMFYI